MEKQVYFGSSVHEKAADIVVWEKGTTDTPYIIVECKKPKRKDGLEQLKSYCNAEGSPIGVWTNGGETIYLHREDPNLFRNLDGIPRADQTLADMLNQPWTLDDLDKENILVEERTSLKDIILDMEDLVLANAGVDAFEEVFKLIYAKLYDEARAARSPKGKRKLEFRVGGRTPREFAEIVEGLFAKACDEWPGVFQPGERIGLEPDHLKVCGSALERVKLFNSNLSVIDEAFEYLSIKASKGEKGQYFTPRHVIDMCVKMLNPTAEEYVVDTAAGSCGFTVHSIFHVWGDVFSAKGPNQWQAQYAGSRRFRDLQSEGRFDAEYFNPKYQSIIKRLRQDGRTLADIAPLSERTFDPESRPKESTFRYIEIGSLSGDGEAQPEILDVTDVPSRAAWIVKPGDVITSTVRPIRRLSALIRDDQGGCVCSSGFAVLTPRVGTDGIEPEVLLTYLRLPIICEILDLHTTASMYPAIPVDRLMRIPIIIPDRSARKQIVAKVREAMEARREATLLLGQAKKAVENMISNQYIVK